MLAARTGDRFAAAELYRRYAPVVHAAILMRVDTGEAEDLVQEVFLTAMRRLHQLRDPVAFGAWLLTMSRNMAAGHRRRARLWRKHARTIAEHPRASTSDASGLRAEDVLAAIRALPEPYRETLALRLIAGLSGPEISLRTGLSHGSVRVNLHRGTRLLRERLGGTP